jgi:hypothetical protein
MIAAVRLIANAMSFLFKAQICDDCGVMGIDKGCHVHVNTGKRNEILSMTARRRCMPRLISIWQATETTSMFNDTYALSRYREVEIHLVCIMYKVLDSIHDESRRKCPYFTQSRRLQRSNAEVSLANAVPLHAFSNYIPINNRTSEMIHLTLLLLER